MLQVREEAQDVAGDGGEVIVAHNELCDAGAQAVVPWRRCGCAAFCGGGDGLDAIVTEVNALQVGEGVEERHVKLQPSILADGYVGDIGEVQGEELLEVRAKHRSFNG